MCGRLRFRVCGSGFGCEVFSGSSPSWVYNRVGEFFGKMTGPNMEMASLVMVSTPRLI